MTYIPFWYNDPEVLFDPEYVMDIFPLFEYTPIEKLNALVRLSFIISVFFMIYNRSLQPLILVILILLMTFIIWKNYTITEREKEQNESIDKEHLELCKPLTEDNPFGSFNPLRDSFVDDTVPCYSTKNSKDLFLKNTVQDKNPMANEVYTSNFFRTLFNSRQPPKREPFINKLVNPEPGNKNIKYQSRNAKVYIPVDNSVFKRTFA
jgi:hypothetical protein